MKRHWPTGVLAGAFALSICFSGSTFAATSDGGDSQAAAQSTGDAQHKADSKGGTGKQDATPGANGGGQPAPAKPASQSGDGPTGKDSDTKTDKAAQHSAAQPTHVNKPASATNTAPANTTPNPPGKTDAGQPFDYDQLVAMAKARAGKAYQAPPQIPKFLQNLGPSGLDQIQFKRDDALWKSAGLPFQVMFYHPGSYYAHAVRIHLIGPDGVKPYAFDKSHFTYSDADLQKKVPDDLGYAGFKILHALNDPNKMDEVLSFLGASYFRALGANEHYGLSARGLAIDTGGENGEEFPNFTQFWLKPPAKNAKQITLYALLDSPSVAGAYKFVVTPGQATHTHVEETLFTRKAIGKLGVAPLTSMFTWGENSLARLDDYRPEAHDSDGMLISAANGEWLWRPLVNPQTLWMNQFQASNVRGFGLMQRDRNFDHYQDLDYEYERRPNAWITPDGDWGDGHLELVEIPSDSEVNDNIGLYWVPKTPVAAGQRLHFAYDIQWSDDLAVPSSLGHVAASRIGMAAVTPGKPKNQVRVVIDFVGGELPKLTTPNAVQPRVNAMRDVTLNDIQAERNPHTGGWRLSFLVPTSALNTPLELRAYLADANGGGLTETWSYALKTP